MTPFQFSTGTLSQEESVQWLCNMYKSFYEPLIVAHEAKKGSNFCIGLGCCTFGNGFQIQIARLHIFLRDSVHQMVYLFLEETAL